MGGLGLGSLYSTLPNLNLCTIKEVCVKLCDTDIDGWLKDRCECCIQSFHMQSLDVVLSSSETCCFGKLTELISCAALNCSSHNNKG